MTLDQAKELSKLVQDHEAAESQRQYFWGRFATYVEAKNRELAAPEEEREDLYGRLELAVGDAEWTFSIPEACLTQLGEYLGEFYDEAARQAERVIETFPGIDPAPRPAEEAPRCSWCGHQGRLNEAIAGNLACDTCYNMPIDELNRRLAERRKQEGGAA